MRLHSLNAKIVRDHGCAYTIPMNCTCANIQADTSSCNITIIYATLMEASTTMLRSIMEDSLYLCYKYEKKNIKKKQVVE